jgi:1,2-diacylglycerol 3-beta-galactosyltransferase
MKLKKRVLVLIADAGFGHRSAANAIISALEEKHGDQLEISLVNPLDDKRAPFFLRDAQEEYDRIVKEIPNLYQFGFKASDNNVPAAFIDSALVVLLFEVMWDLIKKTKPDVIVTTYPVYQGAIIQVLRARRLCIPLITAVTDLISVHRLWFNRHVEACLVPTLEVEKLALQYKIPEKKIHVIGVPIHTSISHETRDKTLIRKVLGWDENMTTILAVGSPRVSQMTGALNVLNHYGAPLQIVAVAGKDEKGYRGLKATEWHQVAHIYDYVENIPTFMKASDIIICKAGGLITSEALACGLPPILIDVIPGQETGNADFVVDHNAGAVASDPTQVLEILTHWLMNDKKVLNQVSRNAARVGKPQAAYKAADIVWKLLGRKPENVPECKDRTLERLKGHESFRSTIDRIQNLRQQNHE